MKRRNQTRADKEAADWIVRLDGRNVSEEDLHAHEAWMKADPRHEHAFRIQQQIADQIPAAKKLENYDELVAEPFYERLAMQASTAWDNFIDGLRRPQIVGALAAMTIAAIVTSTLLIETPDAPEVIAEPVIEYATDIAQIREQRLPDGSVVTLGAKSRIVVAYSDTERRVTLLAGDAFFDVERDPSRPFFVEARDSVTRVVGTKFDVRLRENTVAVSVAEGRVDVGRLIQREAETEATTLTPAASLIAGQQIVLPAIASSTGIPEITAEQEPIQFAALVSEVDTGDVAAWREGRLKYAETRLADVVADLNRYYHGEIILGDDEVGNIVFTATPNADEIDRLLVAIDMGLPVEVVHRSNGRVILTSER